MRQKILWLLLTPFLLVSCWDIDRYENIGLEPVSQSWVFPIINSQISMGDIVDIMGINSVMMQDEDGLFLIEFSDTFRLANPLDYFSLVEQDFVFTFNQPLVPGFSEVSDEVSFTQEYKILDGADLKSVSFYSGFLTLDVGNQYEHEVQGIVSIPSLVRKDDGSTFSASFSNFYSGGIDLGDYILSLEDATTHALNTFMLDLSLTFTEGTSPDYNGMLTVNLNFLNPDFELLIGRIEKEIEVPQQNMGVFASALQDDFYFSGPYLKILAENEYGLPVSFAFDSIGMKGEDDDYHPFENRGTIGAADVHFIEKNALNSPATISAPAAKTEYNITSNNSNLHEVLNTAPSSFLFGTTFYMGDHSVDNFIKRDSRIDFITTLGVPLHGWVKRIELSDTLTELDLPDLSNEIDVLDDDYSIDLMFTVENGLPIDIYLNLETLLYTALDGYVSDHLFFEEDTHFAKSAPIGASGEAVGRSKTQLNVHIPSDVYQKLIDSDATVMKFSLATGEGGNTPVKIFSKNDIKIQMSVALSGTLKVKL